MLQRLVLSLIIVSLCGYGTAWAYSGHSGDIAAHFSVEIDDDDHGALGDEGCDHCCHAGSHLTGLVYIVPGLINRPADGYCGSDNSAVLTLNQPPPFKPPRH